MIELKINGKITHVRFEFISEELGNFSGENLSYSNFMKLIEDKKEVIKYVVRSVNERRRVIFLAKKLNEKLKGIK